MAINMRRFLSVAVLSLLVTLAVPSPAAAETREYVYDLAYGASTPAAQSGIVYDVCFDINTVGELAGDDQLDEFVCGLNGGHLNIGGVQAIETPPVYTSAVISSRDEVGGVPYMEGAYSETGPEEPGFTNPSFDSGCRPLFSPVRESDYLNVFVYAIGITDDLNICLGSTGSVFVTYI